MFSAKAVQLNLNDMPLFVSTSVPPNIVVSMDDSGSMAWGFMPDVISSNWRETYYRSAHYNKIYYDPSVNYIAPNDSLGTPLADADYSNATRWLLLRYVTTKRALIYRLAFLLFIIIIIMSSGHYC